MKTDRLSDRSTPSITERRDSDHMIMLTDPLHGTPAIAEQSPSSHLVGDAIAVQSASQTYISDPQARPSFSHSLSYNSVSSAGSLQTDPYKQPFMPPYSRPYRGRPESMHSQSDTPVMEKPEVHSIHNHPASTIASESQSNVNEFASLAHPSSYPSSTGTPHSYVQHTEQIAHPQLNPGYDSSFYVPPSQAASNIHYGPNHIDWHMDNPFDTHGQSFGSIPFSSFEVLPMQWAENLENLVVEGLDVSIDRESTSTPSVEEDPDPAQAAQSHDRSAPTSHPTAPTLSAPVPRRPEECNDDRLQEYVGYEYSDHHDHRIAIDRMDFAKTTSILLKENARKLRLTAQPSCQYGNRISGVKLSEEKRDDIKSMLDDAHAHARLNSPSEREAPRLPRLEIFNILLKSYFHNFHPHHPILHLPSLLPRDSVNSMLEKKNDILIYAMCCAGAFRHGARPIQEYARGMQELLRRTFTYHFEKDSRNVRNLQSLQALHLAIYVGGWSGSAWACELSQSLSGSLDTMLRSGGCFDGQRGDWLEDELKVVAPGEEEERWRAFVEREERKRLVLAQFSHECHLASFTRVKPSIMWSELTMPLECEMDLWLAESAEEWAKLWNQKLGSRLPRGDEDHFNPSATGLLRYFSRLSHDMNSLSEYVKRSECCRHLPTILLGIHSIVSNLAENRSCLDWESSSVKTGLLEAKAMLDYWWAARETCGRECTAERLEFSSDEIPASDRAIHDPSSILFHYTALMLHIPLREVRQMNERNHERFRRAATNRLWRTWKENNGENSRAGLWHAGQIIRIARIMISHDVGLPWLAPMVAEAANVLWSFAALIYHDNQLQNGMLFNNAETFQIDLEEKWENIPISTRTRGVPTIMSRKGEFLDLFDPRGVVNECTEMLYRGPLRRIRHVRGRTMLDEQFITQLDKLVKFGNVKVCATGLR